MTHFILPKVAALGILSTAVGVSLAAAPAAAPASRPATAPAIAGPNHANPIDRYPARPDAWFASSEGQQIAQNVLTWQSPLGAWDKNYDVSKPHVPGSPWGEWPGVNTIDNGATYSELRILAKANQAHANPKYVEGFLKGFDTLLAAQYANGGWPQRFPADAENYGRHITFNDDAMTEVMKFLQEIISRQPQYAFLDDARREKAKAAFDKGLDCILKCQIVVNGKPTVWCAQHDEVTLAPTNARAYELASFSGSEGAHLALFLMSLDHPDDRVKAAVRGAAEWFDTHKLTGIRVQNARDPETGLPDRVVVNDPSAPPLWARFYDLKTEKPFFCGRNGIKKNAMADIERERRAGYAWYGNWGAPVAAEYEKWKAVHP
jgi:pectinesterase